MNKKQKTVDKKKLSAFIAIGILFLCGLSFAAAYFVNSSSADGNTPPKKVFDIVWDSNATEGGWEQKSEEDIQAELNSKVEEGMINMSMNTSPYFVNGKSAGNLMIVNETVNRYPQIIEIYRNDTNELIYTSQLIAIGSKIEADTLDVELSSGVYKCTAMFHSVDPETGIVMGSAGMVIELTVKD